MIANLIAVANLMREWLTGRHMLTALCLATAIVLYAAGWTGGAGILFLFGAAFELAFWFRVLNKDPSAQTKSTDH
ncbi:MAG: hypothetical protein JNK75_03515 [Betaproteobacteria bacterium]|nr:hypothetical protein [Betaproteobacteria bacterium]